MKRYLLSFCIKNKKPLVGLFIFTFTLFIFLLNLRTSYTTDAMPTWMAINSLISDGNLDLTEFDKDTILRGITTGVPVTKYGNIVAYTPPMTALLSLPIFKSADSIVKFIYHIKPGTISEYYQFIGKITASILISLSAVIMFFLLTKIVSNWWISFFGTLIFVFCSPLYAIDGQALWQHPISIFFLVLSIYYLQKVTSIKASSTTKDMLLLGLFLGISVGVRFNNVIPFIIVFLFLCLKNRKKIPLFIIGSLPTILFNIYYNIHYFHNPLSIGYGNSSTITSYMDASAIKAFFGLFFSLNFGFFIFYPIFILSFIGIIYFIKNKKCVTNHDFFLISLFIIIANILFISNYRWYTGGYSWPSRMLSETIPFLFIFFVPFYSLFEQKKVILHIIILPLILITLFLNFIAVYMNDYSYHQKFYTSIDGWIWDKNKNFINFYLDKGDIYNTKFIKDNNGSLRINTIKYNFNTKQTTNYDEPINNIDTCSIFDSFSEATDSIGNDSFSFKRELTDIIHLKNTLDGNKRTCITPTEINKAGEIYYEGLIKKKLNRIIISPKGKTYAKSDTISLSVYKNNVSIFSKEKINLSDRENNSLMIQDYFEVNDKIKIILKLYSTEYIDRTFIESIGFCGINRELNQ
jgi:hypothetical protein